MASASIWTGSVATADRGMSVPDSSFDGIYALCRWCRSRTVARCPSISRLLICSLSTDPSLDITSVCEERGFLMLALIQGHLLEHEGRGSLSSTLKDRGWVSSLTAGDRQSARGFGFFDIKMDLSEGESLHGNIRKNCYRWHQTRGRNHRTHFSYDCNDSKTGSTAMGSR